MNYNILFLLLDVIKKKNKKAPVFPMLDDLIMQQFLHILTYCR